MNEFYNLCDQMLTHKLTFAAKGHNSEITLLVTIGLIYIFIVEIFYYFCLHFVD